MHSVCEELAKEEIAPKQKISFLLLHCLVSILFDAGQAAIVYNLLTSFGSSEIDNGQEICCPLSKKYVRRAADFIRILQAQANKEIDLSIFGSKEYKISIFSKDFFIMKITFWGKQS